jgi:16S rRNA processing protein RimM
VQLPPDQPVVMGRLTAPYGIRGFIRVQVFTETLDSLLDHPQWLVGRGGEWQARQVVEADVHGDGLVVLLDGVTTPEAAKLLRGCEVAVPRGDLPPAEDDEVYWVDLVGCEVINREGVNFGRIVELMETGANDVLVVRGDRERLIPYIDRVVEAVDLDAKRVRVDWPEDF